MARFVHVGFSSAAQLPIAALEKIFGTALDWMRYDAHCWIIYTTTDLDVWRDRIYNLPQIKDDVPFFLCEINVNVRSGYMKKFAWDWLQKSRTK